MDWIKVATTDDLKPGRVIQVEIDDEPVALAQTEQGEYLATSDICSHEYVLLHDGWLEGEDIECPQHGSRFDMRTGDVRDLPATQPVPIFEVKVEGDEILLRGPIEQNR
ncbi:MAG: non-heme iron oxygenase ferredoxin subunit [Actinomycetota bacterium]